MQLRRLGKTDLQVSVLGFGCGAVGGLMVKGDRAEMTRTVAHAIDAGINYFDTAALYGNGQSEENLGAVLRELNADVLVGTKVRLATEEFEDIEAAIVQSVERSLRRLQLETVDLIQLHNLVAMERNPQRQIASVEDVERAMAVFEDLVKAGKARHWGFNGLGEPDAIKRALHSSAQTVQCAVNLLNPSAVMPVSANFAFEDYGQTINVAAQEDVGVIAIRVLAGGALSGSAERHPVAAQAVDPIASNPNFADDVALAHRFHFLVEDSYADSLVEGAIRFVVGQRNVATALVGISTFDQLAQAINAANRGPLPQEALDRLPPIWG